MKKRKHVIPKIAGCIILLGILAYGVVVGVVCIREVMIKPVGEYNGIIVLGAQVLPDGTPNLQLKYRLDKALEMYNKNRCAVVVCGAQGSDEPCTESYAMKKYLMENGAAEGDIYTDDTSFNTRQNIKNAAAILQNLGIDKCVIVTSDYHVARSLDIARDEGLDATGVGSPTTKRYWVKNHCREALSMIKYWAEKYILGE